MKAKPFISSIIVNLFLGYLWLVLIDHVVGLVNSMDTSFIVGGSILAAGTLLFGVIFHRTTDTYTFPHPVKIAGIASFALVVMVHVFVYRLV